MTGYEKYVISNFCTGNFLMYKKNVEPQGDLQFQSVTIIAEGEAKGDIRATASVVGPNLCYKFTHFQVSNTTQNQFDIYAKGVEPSPEQICAQALYSLDTTVSIPRPAPGTYALKFWNPGSKLFKSETVVVD